MSTTPKSSWPEERLPVPMETLHERIDEVRTQNPDFASNLRDIANELPRSNSRRDLLRLAKALDANQSAASLARSFPKLRWLLTVRSSSATTDLLTVMLEQSVYDNALQQRRIGKVAYPFCLLAIGLTIFLFICVFVVPTFHEMYDEFALRLPAPTETLMSLSAFVNQHFFVTLLLAAAFFAGLAALLWAWVSEGPLKQAILGHTPKSSQTKFSLAGAAQQLAELADDGLPLDQSLRIAAESNTEPKLRAAIGDLANQARQHPKKLSVGRASVFLPPNFLLALQSEPESGGQINAPLMRVLASSYRDQSVHRKDWTSFLIGPIAFVGMGLMIGFVVVALFSPMLSLITGLSS